MKKISLDEAPKSIHNWRVGDLVKIKSRAWDAIVDSYSTGVVTEIIVEDDKQQLVFPLMGVYDFKLKKINKVYPSNLEILSSIK
jgi:hypothetical protein